MASSEVAQVGCAGGRTQPSQHHGQRSLFLSLHSAGVAGEIDLRGLVRDIGEYTALPQGFTVTHTGEFPSRRSDKAPWNRLFAT
ncbi:MAG TPA: hypothetical protein VII56_07385 [Rhizomicrobium sp.]